MLKILALDPGITTGYALGLIMDGKPMSVASGQGKWNVEELHDFLEEQKPDIIIYEDFEYRNRARAGLELFSRNLIGIIQFYHLQRERRHEPVVVYCQKAATGKGYYSNKHLKDGNVYKKANPHANDAMRHLLHWFTFGSGYKFNTLGFRPA